MPYIPHQKLHQLKTRLATLHQQRASGTIPDHDGDGRTQCDADDHRIHDEEIAGTTAAITAASRRAQIDLTRQAELTAGHAR